MSAPKLCLPHVLLNQIFKLEIHLWTRMPTVVTISESVAGCWFLLLGKKERIIKFAWVWCWS